MSHPPELTNKTTTSTILRILSPMTKSIPITLLLALISPTEAFQVRYCNRGFCYTKNHNNPNSPNDLLTSTRPSRDNRKRTGLDFCTDGRGHVTDCELLEVLGFEDYEGVTRDETKQQPLKNEYQLERNATESIIVNHIPWREKPKKGKCIDNDAGYAFDCNLIEILDEGLVLIEDLRAGGVFYAQPKSGFTTRVHNTEPIKTPKVMNGSIINPMMDFRTNALLNLEGI